MKLDLKFYNILVMGFGFMFVFTAFQTMGNIEKTFIDSIKAEDSSFQGDAYSSLSLIYAIFAISNWLSPSILAYIGARAAMVTGASFYCFFVITFLLPRTWLLYVASGIVGVGSSITWTGQGVFLARCSTPLTIVRNTGIFWIFFQMSQIIGNLYIYYEFENVTDHITKNIRIVVITMLSGSAILGMILLALLRHVPDDDIDDQIITEKDIKSGMKNALNAFTSAIKLLFTKNMILLSVTFLYTGAELSFYSGVYGPSIGFTLKISESPKQIVGLAAVFIGIGGIFSASLFGILGTKLTNMGRCPIILTGLFVHVIAFILIALNLPNNAPFEDTMDIGYLNRPQIWLALFCGFLLGFGDACFITQIFSMLSVVFVKQSVGAFALFNFFKSIGAAICFFYSSYIGLYLQLGILGIFALFASICFCYVEKITRKIEDKNEIKISL